MKRALQTYREVFAATAKCPSPGAPGTILGYPACVYGFVMYFAITVTAVAGLVAGRGRPPRATPEPDAPARVHQPPLRQSGTQAAD